MTNDFNKVQIKNINNRLVIVGEAPNVIANKFCVGEGFLTEAAEAHPGLCLEVKYEFADSFGERFGAQAVDDGITLKPKTGLQRILEPINKARYFNDFNDVFEVQLKAGSGDHAPVSIDYEVMRLVKEAVNEYCKEEKEIKLVIDNYWPAIKPSEFYLARVSVKAATAVEKRSTAQIIVK